MSTLPSFQSTILAFADPIDTCYFSPKGLVSGLYVQDSETIRDVKAQIRQELGYSASRLLLDNIALADDLLVTTIKPGSCLRAAKGKQNRQYGRAKNKPNKKSIIRRTALITLALRFNASIHTCSSACIPYPTTRFSYIGSSYKTIYVSAPRLSIPGFPFSQTRLPSFVTLQI